jgi:hypothetical protein
VVDPGWHRRGLRHGGRFVAAAVGVFLIVAGGAVWLLLLGSSGGPPAGRVTVVSAPSTVSAAASTALPGGAGQSAGMPRFFLGGIGGGGERTAVISVATGRVLRYLSPPPGAQALGVLSPDRRIWFEPSGEGPCGSAWRAIAVASGRIAPALGGEGNIETFALDPDGDMLAMVKARPLGGTRCEHRLLVRDLRTGRERSWPLGPTVRLSQLGWSPDSTRLAYDLDDDRAEVRHRLLVVRVAAMRAVDDGLELSAPQPGCTVSLPRFRTGSGRLLVAEHCGGAGDATGRGRALLEYDPVGGAPVGTLARVPAGAMITDLSVDASGRHVLVLLFPGASSQATAYAVRDGTLRRLFQGAYTASW